MKNDSIIEQFRLSDQDLVKYQNRNLMLGGPKGKRAMNTQWWARVSLATLQKLQAGVISKNGGQSPEFAAALIYICLIRESSVWNTATREDRDWYRVGGTFLPGMDVPETRTLRRAIEILVATGLVEARFQRGKRPRIRAVYRQMKAVGGKQLDLFSGQSTEVGG